MAPVTQDPPQPPTRLSVAISPEVEVGVHADLLAVWHDPGTFVLDFATYTRPPVPAEDQDGNQHVLVQTRVVARIRIPPSQIFEVMKVLERQLTAWEKETGQRPAPPLDPTDS